MVEITYQGALWFVLLTKCYSGDQIKKNNMGGACSLCGKQERCIQGFWWVDLRERSQFEELGLVWRVILK
jgi:hypothetical protein